MTTFIYASKYTLLFNIRGGGFKIVEHRKLIKFGESSFVISLPASWIRKNKLTKGSVILLEEKTPSELIISLDNNSSLSSEEKEEVIDVDGKEKLLLYREITSAYIRGITKLILKGNQLRDKSFHIKDTLNKLMGFEILEQTNSRIVAKDLLSIDNISVQQVIRKISIITESMIEDSKKLTNSLANYKHLYSRDEDVNRLSFLVLRVIKMGLRSPGVAKKIKMNNEEMFNNWNVVECLEEIADEAKRINKWATKLDISKVRDTGFLDLYEEVEALYKKSIKAIYTKNKKLAMEVTTSKKNLMMKCNKIQNKNLYPDINRILDRMRTMIIHIRNISREVYTS